MSSMRMEALTGPRLECKYNDKETATIDNEIFVWPFDQ